MKILSAFDISASGLSAQRKRINTIVENIANANSSTYKYKKVVMKSIPFSQKLQKYVEKKNQLYRTNPKHMNNTVSKHKSINHVNIVKAKVIEDKNKSKLVYDKNHPDADANGYVRLPDINIVTEMASLLLASRAYEANITALNAAKEMDKKALEI